MRCCLKTALVSIVIPCYARDFGKRYAWDFVKRYAWDFGRVPSVINKAYSALNASIGETRDARRAGAYAASSATVTRIAGAAMNVSGSRGLTP